MLVYLITNIINGKRYVGATTRGLEQRFKEHIRGTNRRRHQIVHDAIKKYGTDAFTIVKLQDCQTLEELELAETRWIAALHTLVNEHGYNVAITNNAMKGRKHSTSTRQLLSELNRGQRHPMWGKHHTNDARERIRVNSRRRAVEQLTLDGTFVAIYPSIKDAARTTEHPDPTKIGLCCRGKRESTRGFRWRYAQDP